MMKLFCLKCKAFTKSKNIKKVTINVRGNKRLQLKALCSLCNCKKCTFISHRKNE